MIFLLNENCTCGITKGPETFLQIAVALEARRFQKTIRFWTNHEEPMYIEMTVTGFKEAASGSTGWNIEGNVIKALYKEEGKASQNIGNLCGRVNVTYHIGQDPVASASISHIQFLDPMARDLAERGFDTTDHQAWVKEQRSKAAK